MTEPIKQRTPQFTDAFLCETLGDHILEHLATCETCQRRLIPQFALVESLPFVGTSIRNKLDGLSIEEFFKLHIWKGK